VIQNLNNLDDKVIVFVLNSLIHPVIEMIETIQLHEADHALWCGIQKLV